MIKRILLGLVLTGFLPFSAEAQVGGLPDFTELVAKQGGAVVNISTTQIVRSNRYLPQIPNVDPSDPMFDFFRRFIPRQPGPPREFERKSLGSGFIISDDGYILTNAHVVASADEISVTLADKREFKARIVGADERSDVALIKIDAHGLPKVTLGDPNKLKVGEWVVAIGSPFGFESSVTAGIVSAKGRWLPQENYVSLIQTDVAINPGNSGGPLFNMKGEVVGMNSQIYSRTGGYMGLSFAIPIDIAMQVQRQLRATGHVRRGRIGVVIQEVTQDLAKSFGLDKPSGALVASVDRDGPSQRAGIKAGDVILKFDGKTVNSSSDLPRIVGQTKPGSHSTMTIWRNGATREITVVVGEVPEEKLRARHEPRPPKSEQASRPLGLTLSELTAEQKKELNVPNGLLVKDAGGRSDLQRGDVIVAVVVQGSNRAVDSVAEFDKLLGGIGKGARVTLLVRRGDLQTFISAGEFNDE